MWAGCVVFVSAMVGADMVLPRTQGAHKVSLREAAAWVLLALAFNGLLWWYLDGSLGRAAANAKALEFLTGYLMK
jgi:tellurite resistance protein TerC